MSEQHGGEDDRNPAHERLERAKHEIESVGPPSLNVGTPIGASSNSGFGSSSNKSDSSPMKLVCASCNEYYKHHSDWEVCPKCGEDLIEVDRA